jgi:hypothetical protein
MDKKYKLDDGSIVTALEVSARVESDRALKV